MKKFLNINNKQVEIAEEDFDILEPYLTDITECKDIHKHYNLNIPEPEWIEVREYPLFTKKHYVEKKYIRGRDDVPKEVRELGIKYVSKSL